MNIELEKITIRDLVEGYTEDPNKGVWGYGGRLNIRPAYQREFRYNDNQKKAVIRTIMNRFPLNVMYWSVTGEEKYEMIDGQQRTLSICEFYKGKFSIKMEERGPLYFNNLKDEEKELFLDYDRLLVYFCTGTEREKLEWFKVINIAGEKLLDQELRNAVYVGPYVTDARRHFSKNNCAAYNLANKYMNGVAINQDYLETALKWISRNDGMSIDEYMATHQHDPNANQLWRYFQDVIAWVKGAFTKYRKEMKGLDWGLLHHEFGENIYDTNALEKQIGELMEDDEIMKKSGIYRYVLSHDERDLCFRTFDMKMKREAYERQKGICPMCGKKKHYELDEMEADHKIPWSKGGKTTVENCQMLCKKHNREKGAE